jgi:hypothetical protein
VEAGSNFVYSGMRFEAGDVLNVQDAVIELPVAVGAECDEVVDAADNGNGCPWRKILDRVNMTDFDVFVVAAVLADTRAFGLFKFLTSNTTKL